MDSVESAGGQLGAVLSAPRGGAAALAPGGPWLATSQEQARQVLTDPDAFDFIPDRADRKFAALAAATGAVLVTSDRHLLDGRPHSGVVILTPGEFVERAGWRRCGRSD